MFTKLTVFLIAVALLEGCQSGGGEVPEAATKLFPIDTDKLLQHTSCSQIITKTSYTTCYDYSLRSLRFNFYTLDGSKVNAEDPIEERPDFYAEESIPEPYRASYYDYVGFDRGHMRSDASSDYDEKILYESYSLGANIVAQYPVFNRYVWSDVERYSRLLAKNRGYLQVLNVAVYDSPPRMNQNVLAVARGFYKILYSSDEEYHECYYYPNQQYREEEEIYVDTHALYRISCDEITLEMLGLK